MGASGSVDPAPEPSASSATTDPLEDLWVLCRMFFLSIGEGMRQCRQFCGFFVWPYGCHIGAGLDCANGCTSHAVFSVLFVLTKGS